MGQLGNACKKYIIDQKQKNDQKSPMVPAFVRDGRVGTFCNHSQKDRNLSVAPSIPKVILLYHICKLLSGIIIMVRFSQKAKVYMQLPIFSGDCHCHHVSELP
jgi:hypothetical protein